MTEKEKVRIKNIKQKITTDQLLQLNNVPREKSGNWFAPWRDNKNTPALTCFISKVSGFSAWKDHGETAQIGGDVIDLYCKLHNCSLSKALNELENIDLSTLPPTIIQKKTTSGGMQLIGAYSFDIQKEKGLFSGIYRDSAKAGYAEIFAFIKKRSIAIDTLTNIKACKIVQYRNKGRDWWGIGLKNDKGGYEIRGTYKTFKTSTKDNNGKSTKSISTIYNGNSELILFEGMFDFFSAVALFRSKLAGRTIIVLNSTKHIESIDLNKYTRVFAFLDNDPESKAGQKATSELAAKLKNKLVPMQKLYRGGKDLNEAHVNGKVQTNSNLIDW